MQQPTTTLSSVIGLVGSGISGSLSPHIHGAAFRELGLPLKYEIFDLPGEENIAAFLQTFWAAGGIGLNVTTPFKKIVGRVLGLNEKSSVNTLYRADGAPFWRGTSTDGGGFDRILGDLCLQRAEIERVVFLGSGGAVDAILAHMEATWTTTSLPEVICLTRSGSAPVDPTDCCSGTHGADQGGTVTAAAKGATQEGMTAASTLKPLFRRMTASDLGAVLRGRGRNTLLVHATTAPRVGITLEELVPAMEGFSGSVVDLNYHYLAATTLRARDMGLAVSDGMPMLVEQARLSQAHWLGGRCGSFTAMMQSVAHARRI